MAGSGPRSKRYYDHRRGRDLGRGAAHHSGERHGPLGVGDHAHPLREGIRLVVDRGERLPVGGAADHDPTRPDAREVEGVQRLPALEHHVVGHVHHVVDARHSHGGEPLDEPLRARPHLHAADHPRRVAGADVGGEDLHADAPGRVSRRLERPRVGHVQGTVEQHRDLAGHAEVAEAVGSVARDLELDRGVVADTGGRLVVEARHQQPLDNVVERRGDLHVIRQPVRGDDHGIRTA
jgi:hypothetical protein